LFIKSEPRLLISLLNAIFDNKNLGRVIKSLVIKNPNLEKETSQDKMSVLDIRAELDDGSSVLIEMHMYNLGDLKAKTIRSWARVYGEHIESGESYVKQPPTISIAFANGAVRPLEGRDIGINKDKNIAAAKNKIHRLCMIMDYEDSVVFTDAMELHYIDMKAFVKAINETNDTNETNEINETKETNGLIINTTEESIKKNMFVKWLSLITQKEINNKDIIKNAYMEKEEIFMAVSKLVLQSEDKLTRQAYQRREDEIRFHRLEIFQAEQKMEQERQRAEEAEERAELERLRAEQERQRAEEAEEKIEQEKLRAEREKQRAEEAEEKIEQEKQRAEEAEAEIKKLREYLASIEINEPK